MAAIAPAASRSTVELALRGKRHDVRGRIFAAALLLTLLVSLAVLIVLLGSVLADAWPVLSSRGFGFLGDNLSQFDSRAGVRQGIIGSLILIDVRRRDRRSARDRRGRVPAGVRTRYEAQPSI